MRNSSNQRASKQYVVNYQPATTEIDVRHTINLTKIYPPQNALGATSINNEPNLHNKIASPEWLLLTLRTMPTKWWTLLTLFFTATRMPLTNTTPSIYCGCFEKTPQSTKRVLNAASRPISFYARIRHKQHNIVVALRSPKYDLLMQIALICVTNPVAVGRVEPRTHRALHLSVNP